MENRTDKTMENDMETGLILGFIGITTACYFSNVRLFGQSSV